MSRYGLRVIAAVLVLTFIFPRFGYCQSSADKIFEELKSQYLSLRNTDIDVLRAQEWENLERKFVEFADKNPRHASASRALFNAAILSEQLYRKFGGQDRAHLSCNLFERLARDYPGDILADDALLRRGDLMLYELGDKEGAKKSYTEVKEAYTDSDMYEVAKTRLRTLENGEYERFVKASKQSKERTDLREQAKQQNKPLIMIDPGHGGEDFGAQGQGGLLEKDVALAVAVELETLLREKLGAVVRLTRRSDIFVPLAERTNLANDFEADLFISLHTNASPQGKLSGLETFYLNNSGDKASRTLAERENSSVRFEEGQNDLQFMLSDLIQNAKLDDSIVLANLIQRSLVSHLDTHWDAVKNLGVRKAPFYVLVGAHMPCVLVEMFFIDNVNDGHNLGIRQFRHDLAYGLFLGIKAFLER